MNKIGVAMAAAAALVWFAAASSAGAQTAHRAWVSGHGVDAPGCGAPISPCRSLQYTHDDIVAAGGEIDILDPAGYGAITITKAISIINDGVGTAGVQQPIPGQAAITIIAGAGDAVTLRGLNIDGVGVANEGIVVGSAASVTIANCVISHFPGDSGIRIVPSSGTLAVSMVNDVVSDNSPSHSQGGILVLPTGTASVSGLLEGVTITNSGGDGVSVLGVFTTGTVGMSIIDSVADYNTDNGFIAFSHSGVANTTLFLDNVKAIGNHNVGVGSGNSAVVTMNRSVVTKNFEGISVDSSATLSTFQNNAITDNTTEVAGTLTPVALQ